MPGHDPDLLAELADIVGRPHVLTAPDATAAYTVDWTGRFRGATAAVVVPGAAAEVAAVVATCRRRGSAVVAQGGNTGLVGGGVPLAGEVVLSLRRLDRVERVDAAAGRVTAGAGLTLAALHRAAAGAGWAYGVDFASRDKATVGGTIATNAGGLHVLRYGDTRAQVIGVEAVLGDGSVVSQLAGMSRAGYHLPSLLCGSEGTLGVVTAATLRLVARADERAVALLAFDAIEAAVGAAGVLGRDLRNVEAVELFLAAGLDLVCRVTGLAHPFPTRHPAYLLVEAADRVSPLADLAAAIESVAGLAAVLVAADPGRRAEVWRYREEHSAAVNTLGAPHKIDVVLPAERMAEFAHAVPAVVAGAAPGAAARTWLWGHAAEGSLHVNVTGLAPDDGRVDDAVLRFVLEMGGGISAEHGIGTAKRAWLGLSRSTAEIEAFRALKRALDPDGILNPNVLLPPDAAGRLV